MGSGASKAEALAAISHPDDKADLEKVFNSFDKDKSGALDVREWKAFGKLLWEWDVEQAHKDGTDEGIQVVRSLITPWSGFPEAQTHSR